MLRNIFYWKYSKLFKDAIHEPEKLEKEIILNYVKVQSIIFHSFIPLYQKNKDQGIKE